MTVTAELLLGLFIAYGYWIVFTAILLDNAGLPIPGELLLLAFGALAKAGHLDPLLGLAVAAVAALAGDSLAYWLGRVGGARMVARLGRSPRFTPGRASIVFGRFVVGVRVLLAPLAGVTRMPFPRFLAFDALGCLVWAGVFILIGYVSGVKVETLQQGLRLLSGTLLFALVAGLATWGTLRLLGRRRTA